MPEGRQRQFELKEAASGATLICWLDDATHLKVGVRVTLKGVPQRVWTINARYHELRSVADADFRRGWRVGGLA